MRTLLASLVVFAASATPCLAQALDVGAGPALTVRNILQRIDPRAGARARPSS